METLGYALMATAAIVVVAIVSLVLWCAYRRRHICNLVVAGEIKEVFQLWGIDLCVFDMETDIRRTVSLANDNRSQAIAWLNVLRFRNLCIQFGIGVPIAARSIAQALDALLIGKAVEADLDWGILLRRTVNDDPNDERSFLPMTLCVCIEGNAFVDTKRGRVFHSPDAISLFAKANEQTASNE